MKIIIPASGIGKRFIDAGYTDTKPLIEVVQGKRIIDYVISSFDVKNDEFFIISSASTFNAMDGYLKASGLNYKHLLMDGPKSGPVGCVAYVKDELAKHINSLDQVIVSYCDYGMEWDYNDFKQFVNDTNCDGAIPCYTGYHPHLEKDENVYAACKVFDGEVYEVKEKYKSKNRYSEFWSAGLYYFKTFELMNDAFTDIMNAKDTLNDEYYVSMAYNYITNRTILVYPGITKFYQFGTPSDFEYARANLIKLHDLKNDECSLQNVVVLSAGKGERFLNVGFNQPKPFLPLSNTDLITNITKTFDKVQTTLTYVGSEAHARFWAHMNAILITPNKIGAAYSYKEGCSNIKGETLIVPCDLVAKHITPEFIDAKADADAIIFVSEPSDFALNNKNSFAWVGGTNGDVHNISIKETADDTDMVLIGSFWVKDNQLLLDSIDRIFEKKFTVNGEYYLDNAFKELLDNGCKVKYIKLDTYFSLGTPQEYKENAYWLNGVLDA